MYNLKRNNYNSKPKNSTIYTPPAVSRFIFELISPRIWDWRSTYNMGSFILDPCSGTGNLLESWGKTKYSWEKGYPTVGIDINPNSNADWKTDFLSLTQTDFYQKFKKPTLILCNPPFNGYGNKLGSEIWLDKIIELFGDQVPIVLFTPMGFRLNSKKNGKRWGKFINDKYPSINSIISLPRDIFPEVEFHSEILIFNIKGLKGHYFYKPNE